MMLEHADEIAELAKKFKSLSERRAAAVEANMVVVQFEAFGDQKQGDIRHARKVERRLLIEPQTKREGFKYLEPSQIVKPSPKAEFMLDLVRQMMLAQLDHEIAIVTERLKLLGVTDV